MNRINTLGLFLMIIVGGGLEAASYQRSKRYSHDYGWRRPCRGWYVYKAPESYRAQEPQRQRVWWGERWWGLGWSQYPHYWTYGRAVKLGLPVLAEEGRWDEIEQKLETEIAFLQDKVETFRQHNASRHGVMIASLNKQIDQLQGYLKDARNYRATPLEHSEFERTTK
ncbi:hypothetical protein JW872_01605 [Candidatus Babeliales bacterium]|nr:hypothetical protein [Candidatus Babeliales bacterium]